MKSINQLPDSSRIWIYQSNRAFTSEEQKSITSLLEQFISTWNAHGSELDASFSIEKGQFIVITVDEGVHAASGCSIDKSVGVIRSIESSLNVSLFERTTVAYLNEEDKVATFKMNEAKNMVSEGQLKPSTLIFDNTIQTLGDFRARWIVEASNSWLKRYFKITA
ncbi:hypothetical protein [Flammeovirga sp. SJP92]|uniref:hypothetical protein n=1 Tax=Flammeovirga sp. SJP92 TaxID=1775430 RepID=UPI000786FE79|nr:hypothetical protein [Flammeovirga sp. SJP92]KXX67422.1 hypothetical protein AVL50_27005 [Flammeovirga sp. SJP92]